MTDPVTEYAEAYVRVTRARLAAWGVEPDLADVLQRARAIAPSRVATADLEACSRLGEVVPLRRARRPSADSSAVIEETLQPFQGALRRSLERRLTAARIPEPRFLPRPVARPRRRARVRGLALALSIAALVALAMGGSYTFLSQRREAPAQLAEDVGASPTRGQQAAIQPEPPGQRPQATPERSPETVDVDDPPAPPRSEPEGSEPVSRSDTKRASAERLDELDRRAQALWRAGDRVGAERAFRTLVRVGGRDPRAEIAYGELFTLTRQLHGVRAQIRLWRSYLRRFPRGRYADTASAGLCRHSVGPDAVECWTRYLSVRPTGSFRKEAAAALARGAAP